MSTTTFHTRGRVPKRPAGVPNTIARQTSRIGANYSSDQGTVGGVRIAAVLGEMWALAPARSAWM